MRIQAAAAKCDLTCHTLRYYEKSGLVCRIQRDQSGHRFYSEQDIQWINFVKCLKMTGMPLKDIRDYAQKMGDYQNQGEFLLQIMQRHKVRLQDQLKETQQFLEHIDWKINHYEKILVSPKKLTKKAE